MTKNKGYTLVEMLIVIAIMAALAGLSMYSIGVIRNAKRQAAVTTFDNQISSCLVKTKAVSEVTGDNVVCMYISKKNTGSKNYCIKVGYNTSAGVKDVVKGTVASDTDETTWDAVLPKDVIKIEYNGTAIADGGSQKIIFNKSDGSVTMGGGSYKFYKNDNEVYATVYLDAATGKHYIRY